MSMLCVCICLCVGLCIRMFRHRLGCGVAHVCLFVRHADCWPVAACLRICTCLSDAFDSADLAVRWYQQTIAATCDEMLLHSVMR